MEVGGGLVVLDPPDDGTVDDHLLVGLHLSAHDPKGVGRGVVVDLDAAEGLGARACGEPALVAVIVQHYRGPAGADDGLTHGDSAGQAGFPGAPLDRASGGCDSVSPGVPPHRSGWLGGDVPG